MCCILRQLRGLGAFFEFWLRFSQSAWRLGKLNIPEGCCTFLKIVEDDRARAADEMNWLCSRGMVSAGDRDKTCRARILEACTVERGSTIASDPQGREGASEPASSRSRCPPQSARCRASRSGNSVSIDTTNPLFVPPGVSSPRVSSPHCLNTPLRRGEIIPSDASRLKVNSSPLARIRGVDRPGDPMHDGSAEEQALMRSRARQIHTNLPKIQDDPVFPFSVFNCRSG
jgi:hypothetical protein